MSLVPNEKHKATNACLTENVDVEIKQKKKTHLEHDARNSIHESGLQQGSVM